MSHYPGGHGLMMMPQVELGPRPTNMQCPRCRAHVITETESKSSFITWLTCFLCCAFGCGAGCCLIPFCVPELQDADHTCPNCKNFLGTYRRCK